MKWDACDSGVVGQFLFTEHKSAQILGRPLLGDQWVARLGQTGLARLAQASIVLEWRMAVEDRFHSDGVRSGSNHSVRSCADHKYLARWLLMFGNAYPKIDETAKAPGFCQKGR